MELRQRRSLSAPRGPVRTRGPRDEASLLESVLRIKPGEGWRTLTHPFHTYAGRMHPAIPRRLLAELSAPGDRVLDPFCGSGTTLVEAMLAGCRGYGIDSNPIAVRIARIKCSLWSEEELDALADAASDIGQQAFQMARERARSESPRRAQPFEVKSLQPHVRFEVGNILEGIRDMEWSRGRDALEMVLSSILIKVSNLRSETSLGAAPPSLARGFTSRFFAERTHELCDQLSELARVAPDGARPPRIVHGDARRIRGIQPGSVRLVVTSPPYLGTYDYAAQHRLRATVLDLDMHRSALQEIGSRRAAREDPERAVQTWQDDLAAVLSELSRLLEDGGDAFILIGTSRAGRRIVPTERFLEEMAPDAHLEPVAMATQELRAAAGSGTRDPALAEHLLWLRRRPRPTGSPAGPRRSGKGRE